MTTPGPGRTKVKLNLYLKPKLVAELGKLAQKFDKSRSEVVERAVVALMMVERENECQRRKRLRKKKNGNNHAGV